MIPRRLVLVAGFLLACPCAALHAQGTWDAILTIDPYPSPYYSDWDANPNISSLTVINMTASSARVRIHFSVTDRSNQVVVSGSSEPEQIGAGATVIFDSPYDVAGSTTHDTELEEIAARTGRLPEGDYTACAVAADDAGFVLAESCSMFTIVYPDPPLLLGPMDGEMLDQPDPLFLWTPVQVPFDYQLTYVVRVAEVLAGQSAADALRSNIPHFQSLDGQLPSLRYPIDARPFETATTYAWTVQALDQNGYSASANDGRSEIWSFRYEHEIAPPLEPPAGSFAVELGFYEDGVEEAPELLRLLAEGTFQQLKDYIFASARDGTLQIRLPAPVGGLLSSDADTGAPAPSGAEGGQAGAGSEHLEASASPDAMPGSSARVGCGSFRVQNAGMYSDSLTIAVRVDGADTPIKSLLECHGIPAWSMPAQYQQWSLMFVASRSGGGTPRVFLALKPRVFDFVDHVQLKYAVFILNVVGDFEINSADLPDEVSDYFGNRKFEIWGPSGGEILRRFVGTVRGKPTAGKLTNLLGLNFYGEVDFSGPVRDVAEWVVGVPNPTVTLRGFAGSREKTYRGLHIARGGSPTTFGIDNLRVRDNWFLEAAIEARPPPWLSFMDVTERRFELQIGSQDTSVAGVGLTGESDMAKRYRILVRDVMGGFGNLRSALGVHPDSTLELYSEFKVEASGATTLAEPVAVPVTNETRLEPAQTTRTVTDSASIWDRSQFSLTYGATVQLNLLRGWINLFDPRLIIARNDQHQALLSNPFKNLSLNVGSAFGIGGHQLGTLEVEFTTRVQAGTDTSSQAKSADATRLAALEQKADSLQQRYWEMNESLSEMVAALPAGDSAAADAVRTDELMRTVMAEVRYLERASRTAREEYRTEAVKAGVEPKTKIGYKITARLDQAATIQGLIRLGREFWENRQ